jgi:hypothetical protein
MQHQSAQTQPRTVAFARTMQQASAATTHQQAFSPSATLHAASSGQGGFAATPQRAASSSTGVYNPSYRPLPTSSPTFKPSISTYPLSTRPPSTAQPHTAQSRFLEASFRIGSRHGRVEFDEEERVFHRSDVPQKAREAQAFVQQFLQTNVLAKQHPVWDVSTSSGVAIRGSKHCSWETPLDTFDNRYYHKVQSDHLVGRAQHRIELIRKGIDPDEDHANVNPRWNVSTLVEDKGITALSSGKPGVSDLQGRREIKHLPADHKTLIQLQTSENLHNRHLKVAAATLKEETEKLEASWNAWKRAEHVQGDPNLPPLPAEPRDKEKIAAEVAAAYPSEALQTFLWQQENPDAAAKAGLSPLAASHQHHSHAPKHSVHHPHRSELSATHETLPYTSKVPPAWYRVEARAAQVARSRAEAPFPKFAHPGSYSWVEQQNDGLLGAQESKEWTSADEVGVAGGTYQWSCCLHPLRDARGCTAIDTDPQKRRIVVARSDDPRSTAALGLAPARLHTTVLGRSLDASHVRARSDAAATASAHSHAAPVYGGTAAVQGVSSGMGLSGPGVAIVQRFSHTGLYGRNHATGEELWSCCGAGDREAKGCTSKTVTREHRWQVDSA